MAMPTTAAAIGSILAVTSEMTLTTNPMIDSTTATDQAQLFPSNRLYATTNDAIHRVIIFVDRQALMRGMQTYHSIGSVASRVVIKACCNLVGGKLMSSFLADSTTQSAL